MKRVLVGLAVAAACLSATPAAADQATLPGGTAIAVDIKAPSNGGYVATGAVEVSGTASVAEGVAAPDVTVVYVLDVSLSTALTAGANCDGASGNDSILKCEIAAVKSVNADATLPGSPVLNSGVVTFHTTATIRDVNPDQAGVQRLAPPGEGVDDALGGLFAFGGTLYGPGLAAAADVLADPSAGRTKIVVLVTDGGGSGSATLPIGTIVETFQIGGTACAANLLSFSTDCQVVNASDLPGLGDIIAAETIGSRLTGLSVSVDGGAAVPISAGDITPPPVLPRVGPASVAFTTTVDVPSTGSHEICVTATGDDAGGVGSAEDCVTVQALLALVDCSALGTCQATVTGSDGSLASFRAPESFVKTIGMRWVDTAAGQCGGTDCSTGYDVLFFGDPSTQDVVAELTVVMPKDQSIPPGSAAVFMDGKLLTAKCGVSIATSPVPCAKITKTNAGETQYYVLFDADPGFTFR